MTDGADVALTVDRGVGTITLDRVARHNSLVPEFLEAIGEAIDSAVRAGVDAIVVQAAGRTFSTGGDVAAFHRHRNDLASYAEHVVGALNAMILKLIRLDVPTVVAVHGIVTGGSLGLVLGCDVALVAPEASFTPWYREVGFSPDGGWTVLLPRLIGPARSAHVLMTNQSISAEQALAWGIAAKMVSADEIRAEAQRTARHIASGVGGSIAQTKARLWSDVDAIAAGLDDERRRFVEQVVSPEVEAGMEALLERLRGD